jgi:hypothetical protein
MLTSEVIRTVAEKLGYPQTEAAKKRYRSRWISYINEKLPIEANTLPITVTQKVNVIDKWIFHGDLQYRPALGCPTISQCGRTLKIIYGYNIPAHYVVPDALDGQAEITYAICAPFIVNEQSDLQLFSGRFEKIVSYVEMREHMYCYNKGRLTRRKEFSEAVITDEAPESVPDGVIVCQHKENEFYTLHFRCPCGCGLSESVEAIIRIPDDLGVRSKVIHERDKFGVEYTVCKSMPRAQREVSQFVLEDGKISIQFLGAKSKRCFSDYSVEDGIIKWRFMY